MVKKYTFARKNYIFPYFWADYFAAISDDRFLPRIFKYLIYPLHCEKRYVKITSV